MIHVRIPEDVVNEIDDLRTGETRGAVITAALREYLHRLRQVQAVRAAAGLLAGDHPPQWRSEADADAWVRSVRTGWDRSE